LNFIKKYFYLPVDIIEGFGNDVIDLLNRISTNQLLTLKPGQTIGTFFLNEKGKIISFASIINNFNNILIVISENLGEILIKHIDKFTFTEDVTFKLREKRHKELFVIYNDVNDLNNFRNQAINILSNQIKFNYYLNSIYGNTFNIITSYEDNSFENEFLSDFHLMNPDEITFFRITNKIPIYPNEINENYNPLECGLDKYISFDKGCYTGQEIIARIDSRKKIPNSLFSFKSDITVKKDDKIFTFINNNKIEAGIITSFVEYKNIFLCLGFIRRIYLSEKSEFFTERNKTEINNLTLIN